MTIEGIAVEIRLGRVKYLRVCVTNDGKVYVSAPKGTSEKRISAFVQQHIGWIKSKLQQKKEAGTALSYAEGQIVLVWGEPFTLRILLSKRYCAEVNEIQKTLTLSVSDLSSEAVSNALYRFYKQQTTQQLQTAVVVYSQATGLRPSAWTVRKMRSRWGSCNVLSGKLTFSAILSARPKQCLRYVVLHELAHLKYPDHGAEFHRFLTSVCPDDKQLRALLNGKTTLKSYSANKD